MARGYETKLKYLWEQSRNGSLTSDNSIWKELRGKTNLSDLQKELDEMNVKRV